MKINLRDALAQGEVNVKFRKVDGTVRDMRATTNGGLFTYEFRTANGAGRPEPAGLIRAFDLDKGEFRSIREDSVISFG